MLFIKDLDENGKPRIENIKCQSCGFITKTMHGLRIHMAIHRTGNESYHDKENLWKSGRYS